MRLEDALCAAENTKQTDIQSQRHAQESVAVEYVNILSVQKKGRAPVYNMEVEENHNFAVNGGLIVHNCMDSMRYFVKSMRIIKKSLRR